MNRNDLAYWFPKLEATGVPVPRTTIVKVEGPRLWASELGAGEKDSVSLAPLLAKLTEAANAFGYPVFLRTGIGSGKHNWEDTCFVPNAESIRSHVASLIEWSECVSMIGLPYDTWAVREFLPLVTTFKAFHGKMPINKERRYFVEAGKVLCAHPYWPSFALEGHVPDEVTDWAFRLEELNASTRDEMNHLTEMSQVVSRAFDGAWSLDWAATNDPKRPWVAIDMAVASESFHWPGCPNSDQEAPRQQRTPAERDAIASSVMIVET